MLQLLACQRELLEETLTERTLATVEAHHAHLNLKETQDKSI